MVLCSRGNEKFFHPRVLNLLKDNENTETLKILKSGCQIQDSLEIHQLRDSWQATLLHYASAYGSEDNVQQLIEFGSDVNAQDKFGRTSLMLAASRDHEVVVQNLLKAGANIHLTDCEGKSAMQMILNRKPICLGMIITLFKHLTLEQIVSHISLDELANKLYEAGYTLQNALIMGNVELMKVMLSCTNTINVRDQFTGGTLLHLAVRMKKIEMVKLLMECGADFTISDFYGSTPLDYLYGSEIQPSAESAEILKIILSRIPSITWMDMTKVLSFGDEQAIRALTELTNVDFSATDVGGNTILHFLIRSNNLNAMKLLNNLTSINVSNNDGYTPLGFATIQNSTEIVKFLLENGAKIVNDGR